MEALTTPRLRWRNFRRRLIWTAAAYVASAGPPVLAQQPKPLAAQVEAVYLLNFGRFTVWPAPTASESSSFDICLLGRDPFGPMLDSTVATETIGGKGVVAKRLTKPQDAVGCRILFVSDTEDAQLKRILQALEKSNTLTVSDMPNFLERGGMIQFVSENSKVRFAINLAAAGKAGLTLRSELLKVALAVRTSGGL